MIPSFLMWKDIIRVHLIELAFGNSKWYLAHIIFNRYRLPFSLTSVFSNSQICQYKLHSSQRQHLKDNRRHTCIFVLYQLEWPFVRQNKELNRFCRKKKTLTPCCFYFTCPSVTFSLTSGKSVYLSNRKPKIKWFGPAKQNTGVTDVSPSARRRLCDPY